MFILIVKHQGQSVREIELPEEKELVFGRGDQADVHLPEEKSLSRQHFKIIRRNNQCTIECLARFGLLSYKGEKFQQISIFLEESFTVPGYEFQFTEKTNSLQIHNQNSIEDGRLKESKSQSEIVPFQPYSLQELLADEDADTNSGATEVAPVIKFLDYQGKMISSKELVGDNWIGGRDQSCELYIQDSKVSRRQFKIVKLNDEYKILDLGSSNGTYLNGERLIANHPKTLKSGDEILVHEHRIYFELRDPHFNQKLEYLHKSHLDNIHIDQIHIPYSDKESLTSNSSAQESQSEKFDFKRHRINLMTGAILILGLAYYYTNDDNAAVSADAKKQEIPRTPSEMAFAKLTIEQQALVKQTYELARSLYTQQKYELARQELLKVQSILPEYLDSKELENFINQALQIISEQQRNELIEKAKAENEIKISITVEGCKKLVNPFVEMNRIDDCLSPVISLNPDHPKIIALKSEVEELITKRKLDEDKNREIREKAKKLKALFEKAKNVEATESGEKAIKAYQEVVRSSLPDIEGLKYLARGRISQITLLMKNKMNDLIAQGDKAILDKNMKAAILAYQKALEIDRFNLKIKTKYEELLNEMRKQMMVPYQEAVLEESVGEVDSAKNRWKKIREQSVPEEEYFQKATIKLKKYGAL